MTKNKPMTYEDAGVNIEAGNEFVERIKTKTKGIGGFAAAFDPKEYDFKDPIFLSGTDGVGTKLMIAQAINKHDTIGIDLVAMVVNDLIVAGAKPLFFLDYLAVGALDVDTAERIVDGIIDGCNQSDCELSGGETAEMPGLYDDGHYDLAGFAVGAVERSEMITGETITSGDVLIGLKSSGVHSNGFSFVRKVIENEGLTYNDKVPFADSTFGETLLTPTKIYVKSVLNVAKLIQLKGLIHVTGGGFYDNIPRVLPKGLGAKLDLSNIECLPVFKWLKDKSGATNSEMFKTFNCSIGMIAVVKEADAQACLKHFNENGEDAQIIGAVTADGEIDISGDDNFFRV